MKEELELLKHVYEDARMGSYTTEKLLKDLKEKDNKIKGFVEDILKQYQEFEEKAKKELEKSKVKIEDIPLLPKMMSSMGIKKEVKNDNSDSSIADMLIEGISMGTTKIEKKIKDYKKEVDKTELKIAKDFLKFQEKTIEELKKYL